MVSDGGTSHLDVLSGFSKIFDDLEVSIAPGANKELGFTNDTFWLNGETERPADPPDLRTGDLDLKQKY